jgi:hypothetical protein
MDNLRNKIIKLSVAIFTPGVLILAYLVIGETLDETITWEQFSFELVVFILWGVAFYHYRRIKSRSGAKDRSTGN